MWRGRRCWRRGEPCLFCVFWRAWFVERVVSRHARGTCAARTKYADHLPLLFSLRPASPSHSVHPQYPIPLQLHCDTALARLSLSLRHEFLGPDPRVAGYKLDANGEYHIKWYDAFLKDHWVDDQKWDFDVRLDARGNWVEVDDDAE